MDGIACQSHSMLIGKDDVMSICTRPPALPRRHYIRPSSPFIPPLGNCFETIDNFSGRYQKKRPDLTNIRTWIIEINITIYQIWCKSSETEGRTNSFNILFNFESFVGEHVILHWCSPSQKLTLYRRKYYSLRNLKLIL